MSSIIGCDAANGTYYQLYSDDRGVCRVYEMSIGDSEWKLWRDGEPFPQRFTGRFDDDGRTIVGRWEKARYLRPTGDSLSLSCDCLHFSQRGETVQDEQTVCRASGHRRPVPDEEDVENDGREVPCARSLSGRALPEGGGAGSSVRRD